MNSDLFATNVIWLSSLALPFLIFVAGNTHRSNLRTLIQAVLAILAGWALSIAHVTAAQAIFVSHASQSELLAFYDRDGAPVAFANVLGWVPAFVIILVTLAIKGLLSYFRNRRNVH